MKSFTTFLNEKNIKKVEDEKTEVSKDTKDVSDDDNEDEGVKEKAKVDVKKEEDEKDGE